MNNMLKAMETAAFVYCSFHFSIIKLPLAQHLRPNNIVSHSNNIGGSMAFWLLLCFWCLFAAGLRKGGVAVQEDSQSPAFIEEHYILDSAEPSICYTFLWEYLARPDAPTDYTPLPPLVSVHPFLGR